MYNFCGFGTLYYGWQHNSDGAATATKWITVLWIPVIPLYRQKLRVLTSFNEDNSSIEFTPFGFLVSETNNFQIYNRLPISIREAVATLSKAYIGLPLILIGPIAALYGVLELLKHYGVEKYLNTTLVVTLFTTGVVVALLNFLWQCVKAIRRSRGWNPNM